MSYKVEKVWKSHGLKCVVIMTDKGHRCGYVGVDKNHLLFEINHYDKIPSKLKAKWEEVQKGDIGKRGAISVLCCDPNDPHVEILFDVHGGITYSGNGRKNDYPIKSDLWWFGYDCAHAGDAKDLSVMSDILKEIELKFPSEGVLRTLEYCVEECESLAKQLKEVDV